VYPVSPERAKPRRRAPRRRRWPSMTPPPAPLPAGQQCFCLYSSASHAADKHAATSHVQSGPATAAIARPRGCVDRRPSRSPPDGSLPPYGAARGTRISRSGHRGRAPVQERRRPRTWVGARRDAGGGRAMAGSGPKKRTRSGNGTREEEVRRSHEETRWLARIEGVWAGAAIGSAKCSTGGVEGRGRLEEVGWGV
jgi:hypothetical protein